MKIYSRSRWGSRTRHSRADRDGSKQDMTVHHSAGFGMAIDTFREQCAAVRQIERDHIDVNGWDDGAYSFVVFQPYGRLRRGRIFELRGWDRIPAANGTSAANRGSIAVCVVGNLQHEKVKLATLWRLTALARESRRRGADRLLGHRDHVSTACPGSHLYAKLPWIRKRSGLR